MAKDAAGGQKKAVQAALASRGKIKGKRDRSMSYIYWIGGMTALLLAACATLLLHPDRTPFQIPVNDPSVITQVNRNSKLWKAAPTATFEGWTIGDVKLLEGVGVSQMGGNVPSCPSSEEEPPESFDATRRWPQCFGSPIYGMGNCTASWAIATASAMSNRFCISDPQAYGDLMLSPQQLLSCDVQNRGCDGGDIDTAWRFVEQQGLVSEMCFPYQADSSVSCSAKCPQEVPLKGASHCALSGELAIRREIWQNGPVVALIFLMDDFLVYSQGLYTEMPTATPLTGARQKQRVIHAVKIVGWGRVADRPYWIIENSWGEQWGENGFARILRGGDADKKEGIVIETYVLAGTPASRKIGGGAAPAGEEEPGEGEDDDLSLDDADLDDDAP